MGLPEAEVAGGTGFIKELIPHIDKNYRTIASRKGRAVEGFSQGGRGAARYMFKYPKLYPSTWWGVIRMRCTDDLCRVTAQRHDPCLLDTFIAAVRYMEGEPKKP